MKKVFLPLFALVSVGAFAQIEIGQINLTVDSIEGTVGVDKNAPVAWKAGAELCKSNSVVMAIGADDKYITQGGNTGNYNEIVFATVDGKEQAKVTTTGGKAVGDETHGLQGQTNGTQVSDAATEGGFITATIDGCVYKCTASTDGYLYVVGKFNASKNLYAFEEPGAALGNYYPLAYRLSAKFTAAAKTSPEEFLSFLTPDSVLDMNLATLFPDLTDKYQYYTGPLAIAWPEDIIKGRTIGDTTVVVVDEATQASSEKTIKAWLGTKAWQTKYDVNGTGVIAFRVYAGCNYYVFARGSKLTVNGFAFSENKLNVYALNKADQKLYALIKEEGSVDPISGSETPETPETPTPVKVINANVELDANAPVYNILGQKVENVTKAGVYIQNGKKFLVK